MGFYMVSANLMTLVAVLSHSNTCHGTLYMHLSLELTLFGTDQRCTLLSYYFELNFSVAERVPFLLIAWKIHISRFLPTSSFAHGGFSNICFKMIQWGGPTAVTSGDVGGILLFSLGVLEHVQHGAKMGKLDAW